MSVRDPRRLARVLTKAQRWALANAIRLDDGRYYPRARVNMLVRRNLHAQKLIGSTPAHPLTKLGLQVREILLASNGG